MKREISVGGIVFYLQKGEIFYLLLKYPGLTKKKKIYWGFPKGRIEKNEKELENEFQEEFEEKNKKEKFEEENKEVEIENLEKKILSLKEAEEQLSNAKEEYLKKYQEYESKKLAFQKEKKEILKNKLKEEIWEEVEKDDMPLPVYTFSHPDSKLDSTKKEKIICSS
jgi:flagellar biosynthesis GTPase FlhF